MTEQHPFAAFIRLLARGPNLSRPLELAEAEDAMAMILHGAARPEQIGAMLMLLRNRGETPAELAGFARAARTAIEGSAQTGPRPDLDWPSYADRHRQLPWFILSALLLAANGIKVLMHGIDGENVGGITTPEAVAAFALPRHNDLAAARKDLATHNFAYVRTADISPGLAELFALRPVFGLRSPINSVARALNPLSAPAQIQGVFHPPYRALHQQAAVLQGQQSSAVFKGGGGEAQRNPLKPNRVAWVRDGAAGETDWPVTLGDTAFDWRAENADPKRLVALWRGEIAAPAPEAAVVGTTALALWTLGTCATPQEAQDAAWDMWLARPRNRYAPETPARSS